MNKLEKALKFFSLILGTSIFTFLIWLLLIYNNFEETTSFFLGGLMAISALYLVYKVGYWFTE